MVDDVREENASDGHSRATHYSIVPITRVGGLWTHLRVVVSDVREPMDDGA